MLKSGRRLFFSAEIEECPGNLVPDQCRICVLRNCAQNRQGLFILPLEIQSLPDAELCQVIVGICRDGFLRFLERLVKSPDVTINERKLISRLVQTWVQSQCVAIFPNRLLVREDRKSTRLNSSHV